MFDEVDKFRVQLTTVNTAALERSEKALVCVQRGNANTRVWRCSDLLVCLPSQSGFWLRVGRCIESTRRLDLGAFIHLYGSDDLILLLYYSWVLQYCCNADESCQSSLLVLASVQKVCDAPRLRFKVGCFTANERNQCFTALAASSSSSGPLVGN